MEAKQTGFLLRNTSQFTNILLVGLLSALKAGRFDGRPKPAGSSWRCLSGAPHSCALSHPLGVFSFSCIASPWSWMLFCLPPCRKLGQSPFACWTSSYKNTQPLCMFSHSSELEKILLKSFETGDCDLKQSLVLKRSLDFTVAIQMCAHHLKHTSHNS